MKIKIILTSFILSLSSYVYSQSANPVEFLWENSDDWYYKKSVKYKGWKYIVIHHSATDAGSVKAFHKYHTKQGYGGIAYHYVIGNGKGMKDGEIKETFRWKQKVSGAHVSGNSWDHNIFGIGIALVGNFEKSKPTKNQMTALKKLIVKLKNNYNINSNNIYGHKHVLHDDASGRKEQTVCPGKNVNFNKLRRNIAALK